MPLLSPNLRRVFPKLCHLFPKLHLPFSKPAASFKPAAKRTRVKGKAKLCYTRLALSDLAVSSGLPFIPASLPGTDFPPSPDSVYL